jgi:hypothetical protein
MEWFELYRYGKKYEGDASLVINLARRGRMVRNNVRMKVRKDARETKCEKIETTYNYISYIFLQHLRCKLSVLHNLTASLSYP